MALILNDRVHRYGRSRGSLTMTTRADLHRERVMTRIDAKRRFMLTSARSAADSSRKRDRLEAYLILHIQARIATYGPTTWGTPCPLFFGACLRRLQPYLTSTREKSERAYPSLRNRPASGFYGGRALKHESCPSGVPNNRLTATAAQAATRLLI
jgi:hypothetical protein